MAPSDSNSESDGHLEALSPVSFHSLSYGTEDLEPTPADSKHRTWTWQVFARAWTSMIMNPASLSSGAALLSLGLDVQTAVAAKALASLLLILALALNGWAGTKYGIPFPVLARSAFGRRGAHFCTLTRGAVAIFWLSFQMWQGSLGIFVALQRCISFELGAEIGTKAAIYAAFLLLHGVLVSLGPAHLKGLVKYTMPALFLGLLGILFWAQRLMPLAKALKAVEGDSSERLTAFFTGVNTSIATWSTLVLNVCDLSRFSPRQKDQVLGQAIGLPLPFVFTGFVGIWVAGATQATFGVAAWQVPQYFAYWPPAVSLLASAVLAVSILVVNVLANILSPINDLMNLAPRRFTFRCCGYVTLLLATAVCPWWTFSDESTFLLTFLSGYAMVTGAIAGVLVTDFWILHRQELDMKNLYNATKKDVKWRAMLAVALGVAPLMPGFLHELAGSGGGRLAGPAWERIYKGGSFLIAFGISGTVHVVLRWTELCASSSNQESNVQEAESDSNSTVSA
eukprot:CAMPEP_0197623498 /NCGR_PEP_ID=MMETSP1338-20131121/3495_1 /TAXON_ID=43686 ORGANISM="Pelagodinium beii, Strain RCC1491" /NCGR_SAMPLE_ID=MMETSP1338 /ASSEMBLY_ACC=CAM_ASM_000754 /LENGTH=509 /DNA_ID=CAMNT_0043193487 /DNA_START=50 /DNA_END=1579 /DNA_ORIENTATION=-